MTLNTQSWFSSLLLSYVKYPMKINSPNAWWHTPPNVTQFLHCLPQCMHFFFFAFIKWKMRANSRAGHAEWWMDNLRELGVNSCWLGAYFAPKFRNKSRPKTVFTSSVYFAIKTSFKIIQFSLVCEITSFLLKKKICFPWTRGVAS